jgi:hypothetical protein
VTSRRQRKRQAQARGLLPAELELGELLQEVLDSMRWAQILGYANQFLLHERLQVSAEEREAVMRAAARAVEGDGRLQRWSQRLQAIREQLAAIDRELRDDRPAEGAADGA